MQKMCALLLSFGLVHAATGDQPVPRELVFNGSFEAVSHQLPVGWETSGAKSVVQQLGLAQGHAGHQCARLDCLAFSGDSPSTHAMLCQVGRIAVRKGQWYRLSFWAKATELKAGSIEVALTNMRVWENAGLEEAFTPQAGWQRFELLFQARENLSAGDSRLQFWFKDTGQFWLDDVSLMESAIGQQWYPQINTAGVKNFIPNSSFECGTAGWGSLSWGLSGWAGNLYRLEGELDAHAPQHGRRSLKLVLDPRTLPVFWFDYYEPVCQPVRRVLVANQGWFCVKPDESLTLSAYLRADAEGVAAQLVVHECNGGVQTRPVTVGKEWQRHSFTFAPRQPFIFIAIGADLEAAHRTAMTLWLDAVQLERGARATAYEPRQSVESFITSPVAGNIFMRPADGMQLEAHTFNNSDATVQVSGHLQVQDFFGRSAGSAASSFQVPPHAGVDLPYNRLCADTQGFFRMEWVAGGATQTLRAAIIAPPEQDAVDAPLGFNHAYPWDFLVRLARAAGIVWWRDWSAKWQTVEPEKGKFSFAAADAQIDRALALDSQVEVLLPFPSANWSSSAPTAVFAHAASGAYPDSRMPVAYAPRDQQDFDAYATAVLHHYHATHQRPVTTFQILNEPVYTSYALPRQQGYDLDDYLKLLGSSYRALKAADPNCRVVGGISANLTAGLTREFVERGGLQSCDIFDLHMYNPCVPAETYTEAFVELEKLMLAHGGPKPIWITEWGCYADDDPACLPQTVGDASMNRCKWPSERSATEHIVKFSAIGFAHGVRKIFFHAGTCGAINSPDAGGVLFTYGGAPRQMYAGIAAFSRLFGIPGECVWTAERADLRAYVFRKPSGAVAIAWTGGGRQNELALPSAVQAFNIMGNELPGRVAKLTATPIYLVATHAADLTHVFQGAKQ